MWAVTGQCRPLYSRPRCLPSMLDQRAWGCRRPRAGLAWPRHAQVRLGPRPGYHQFAGAAVRRYGSGRIGGAAGVPPALPPGRLGGARPGGDPRQPGRGGAGGGRGGRRHRGGGGRGGHRQPARDHRGVGPAQRRSDPPRHRVAGPPHQRHGGAAGRGGARRPVPHPRRPGAGRLLFRHQAGLDPGPRARRPAPRRGRRAGVRHRGQLAGVSPQRRRAAPDRRQQRQPHPALRHPPRPLGRGAAGAAEGCRRRCCRRCAIPPRSTAS